ncbi:MAG TPA: hypothetical protein V6D46_04270, partial [Coleofasciculaceae cyanobacterium]
IHRPTHCPSSIADRLDERSPRDSIAHPTHRSFNPPRYHAQHRFNPVPRDRAGANQQLSLWYSPLVF